MVYQGLPSRLRGLISGDHLTPAALAAPRGFRERDGDVFGVVSPNWIRENFLRGEEMLIASWTVFVVILIIRPSPSLSARKPPPRVQYSRPPPEASRGDQK